MAQIEANGPFYDEEDILMSQTEEWKFNIEFGMYAFSKGKNGKNGKKIENKIFTFKESICYWTMLVQPSPQFWREKNWNSSNFVSEGQKLFFAVDHYPSIGGTPRK